MNKLLNTLIIILAGAAVYFLCSQIAQAGELEVGAGVSNHYLDSNLNYIHPIVSYETEHYGSMTYLNSFDRLGLAVYAVDRHRISSNWTLTLRYGVIYGYKQRFKYKGDTYRTPEELFIGNTGIMLGAVPAVEYTPDNNITFQLTTLGTAVAFVWKLKLDGSRVCID